MGKDRDEYRGSRKHVLDWVESPQFLVSLNTIIRATGAEVTYRDSWMPKGYDKPSEGRLENLGSDFLPEKIGSTLRTWWLKHEAGANTPNWDFLSTCAVEGKPGLILLEAKANKQELSRAGKRLSKNASVRSNENHAHIRKAISGASRELAKVIPGVVMSADDHYQVANRIAFTWRLAQLGVPVVLIYMAFTGDEGIRDTAKPLSGSKDWTSHFTDATRDIFPKDAIGKRIDCGLAPFWLLLASRDVLNNSPTKNQPKKRPVAADLVEPK